MYRAHSAVGVWTFWDEYGRPAKIGLFEKNVERGLWQFWLADRREIQVDFGQPEDQPDDLSADVDFWALLDHVEDLPERRRSFAETLNWWSYFMDELETMKHLEYRDTHWKEGMMRRDWVQQFLDRLPAVEPIIEEYDARFRAITDPRPRGRSKIWWRNRVRRLR